MEGFDLRNLLNPEHWLAMDCDGNWSIFKCKPARGGWGWYSSNFDEIALKSGYFNIPICENWEDSLIQVKELIND